MKINPKAYKKLMKLEEKHSYGYEGIGWQYVVFWVVRIRQIGNYSKEAKMQLDHEQEFWQRNHWEFW